MFRTVVLTPVVPGPQYGQPSTAWTEQQQHDAGHGAWVPQQQGDGQAQFCDPGEAPAQAQG
jgi:hypothetical protein